MCKRLEESERYGLFFKTKRVLPYPATSSPITPKLKVAKLQHHKGFHIIFVESRGPSSLDGIPDFQFETNPDGLPLIDADVTLDSSFIVVLHSELSS